MVKPTLNVLEACSPPSPKGRVEREQNVKRRGEEWQNGSFYP
jgi:hypothetical protein